MNTNHGSSFLEIATKDIKSLKMWDKSKAVTSLEKRHRVFASKESIRIRVTAF